ncbi:hypothetical protein LJC38_00160 [Parabacteroides sp. OttesenSCG-928-K15]|nr:hypothetical protein [Parabacteroides sp. OttesenSCG-928-K15]
MEKKIGIVGHGPSGRMKGMLLATAMMAAVSFDNRLYHSKRMAKVYEPKPQNPAHRPLSKFVIKGVEIEEYSRKDAIKRYNHGFKSGNI